jgi:hypothetical protein
MRKLLKKLLNNAQITLQIEQKPLSIQSIKSAISFHFGTNIEIDLLNILENSIKALHS